MALGNFFWARLVRYHSKTTQFWLQVALQGGWSSTLGRSHEFPLKMEAIIFIYNNCYSNTIIRNPSFHFIPKIDYPNYNIQTLMQLSVNSQSITGKFIHWGNAIFLYIYFTKLAHTLRYIIPNYCPNISYTNSLSVQIPRDYSMSLELITNYITYKPKYQFEPRNHYLVKLNFVQSNFIEIVQGN